MKRTISLLVVLIMATGLVFSGCSKKDDTKKEVDNSSVNQENGDSKESDTVEEGKDKWFHKYEPAITLTGHRNKKNDKDYGQYEKWAEEQLGIKYERKWLVPDLETDNQKLNLAIVSNDIPDIISVEAGDVCSNLIDSGMILPLNDLIDEYASPLTKYMIEQFQDQLDGNFFSMFSKDGKYYAFPEADDLFAANWKNMWLRKDVLDELGKDIPTTLAEFEDILAAYKAKHSDGLPYVYNIQPIMEAHGAYPDKWVKDENGELVFGSVQPKVKEGLQTLRDWYEKGYIDKEFFVKDDTKNMESFVAGKGMAIYGNWWYVFWPFPDLMTNAPDSYMVPVPPLKGPDGKASVMHDIDNGYFNYGRAISANCEHPEALIYMLNEHLDSQYRDNKELRDLMKNEYGYEFKYPYEEAKDPINPDADPEDQIWEYSVEGPDVFFNTYPGNPVHTFYGFKYNHYPMELFDKYLRMADAYKNDTLDQLDMDAYRDYMDNFRQYPTMMDTHVANLDLYQQVLEQDIIELNEFQSAPTKTMVDKNTYLEKLQSETFTKIIIGEKPISAFDEFIDEWYKAGGEQITKEVNEWYKNK
ncbi:extracellular solute-binding protein [Vallitalea guaymasensis]|uniref:extracellular solute-binding protein n=1 Tax=Vallitalea guaymasensis TaxID=1185412 RepID=UPI00272C40A4|nr:extracellular solute-binding protein [Vallitalea guaymasensis]